MKCVGELYSGGDVLLVGLWDYFSGGVDGRCYCLSGSSMVSLLYRKTVLDGSLGNEDVGIRRAHVVHPRDFESLSLHDWPIFRPMLSHDSSAFYPSSTFVGM